MSVTLIDDGHQIELIDYDACLELFDHFGDVPDLVEDLKRYVEEQDDGTEKVTLLDIQTDMLLMYRVIKSLQVHLKNK